MEILLECEMNEIKKLDSLKAVEAYRRKTSNSSPLYYRIT